MRCRGRAAGQTRAPLRRLYPGLMPFITLAIGALMVITYVPALSLWILKFV